MVVNVNGKDTDFAGFKLKIKYILEIESKGYNYFEVLSNLSEKRMTFTPIVEILSVFLKDYGIEKSDLIECDMNELNDIMLALFGDQINASEFDKKAGE